MTDHPMTPLCELAKKHETDKGGWHYRYGGGDSDTCHVYTPFYYLLFGAFRTQVKSLLEIGINAGSSLRMWAEFFPNAKIFGIDCNASTMFSTDQITTMIADQNNPVDLLNAIGACSQLGGVPLDIIIDDGSHFEEHQITSLKTLLPFISDRGLYIIEDMQFDCQPERLGAHVPAGYEWSAINCGRGFGKAHCDPGCEKCHGVEGERLLVIRRKY